jgi:hypothetical protein
MTRGLVFILAGLLWQSAVLRPAQAACDWPGETARAASMIERVRPIIEQSSVVDAHDLLGAASQRLEEARARGRQGDAASACRLARVAESLCAKAEEVVGGGPRSFGGLERMLGVTDDMIRDGASRLPGGGAKEGRGLLNAARAQQAEAWAAFRNGRPRMALKLTLMARETTHRALRRGQGVFIPDAGAAAQAMQQTDRLLTEAHRALGSRKDPGDAPAILAQAERLQELARRQLARGRPGLALSLTRESRLTVSRALGLAGVDPEPGEVRTFLQATEDLVDRLEPRAVEARHDAAVEQLHQARALLEEAGRARDAGQWREAFGATRAASALAVEVSNMLESGQEE